MGFKPKPPKPKGKKKIKAPKPIQPKEGARNIIKVFEGSTDLSQDTASSHEWLKADLEDLTDEELENLNKKMIEISEHVFEDEETNHKIKQLSEITTGEIRVKKSREQKERLRKEIEKELENSPEMKEADITEDFVHTHFADIMNEYQQKLDKGIILPRPEEESPAEFVRDHIKKIISPPDEQQKSSE